MTRAPIPVTLFADFSCPYCYLTESALVQGAVSSRVTLTHRAFLRDRERRPVVAPEEEWETVIEPAARNLGLELFPKPPVASGVKAHEASVFAAEKGKEREMRDAIYRAFWRDGRDIGRIDVLTSLWAELGEDPLDLKIALDIDRFRDRVEADLALAHRLRVPDIPLLFVGSGRDARILFGLQTPDALDDALPEG